MIVNLVPANQVAWHEEKMKRAFFFLPSSLSLLWEFDRCPKLLHFDASYFGVMRYLIELFVCSPMLHIVAPPLLKAMAYSPSLPTVMGRKPTHHRQSTLRAGIPPRVACFEIECARGPLPGASLELFVLLEDLFASLGAFSIYVQVYHWILNLLYSGLYLSKGCSHLSFQFSS